jgi:glycine/D-amino acid oxidase-like deaminating enzyme
MSGDAVTDIAIAGAGIIGLSIGLKLLGRGLSVTVIERQRAMSSASWAAGGMLAVLDPQNPDELMPLAMRSGELYPGYLRRIEELSGKRCHANSLGDAACRSTQGVSQAGGSGGDGILLAPERVG